MAPPPASTAVSPATSNAPPVWVMAALLLFKRSALLAVTVLLSAMPLAPVNCTVPPRNAPAVRKVPPLAVSVSAPVPASIWLAGRFKSPPATSAIAALAPLRTAAMLRSLRSCTAMALPVSATAPTKSLLASVKAMSPLPAFNVDAPPTDNPPLWVIAALPLVPFNAPRTTPRPRFNAPLLLAVSALVDSVPKPSALPAICTSPAVRLTTPSKVLPAMLSVTSPLPALTVVVVPTLSAAAVCVIAVLLLLSDSASVVVMVWPMVRPSRADRVTLRPRKSPPVLMLPPLAIRARSAVPVSRFCADRFSAPPAVNAMVPLAPAFKALMVRLPLSATAMPVPVRLMPAPKRLLPPLSAMLALPASTVLAPTMASAPAFCAMAALVLRRASVLAVTVWPSVRPSRPNSVTSLPPRSAAVLSAPPFDDRVRLLLPTAIACDGRLKVPPAVTTTAPLPVLVSAARLRLSPSVTPMPLPIRRTLSKLLPACSNEIAPVPASTVVAPLTSSAPPLCVIAALLLASDNVRAVMVWPKVKPLLARRLTSSPSNAADRLRWLAIRSMLPLPLFNVVPGRARLPPAVSAIVPPLLLVNAENVRSLLSRTAMPAPVRRMAPWKSLLPSVSVMAPLPALRVAAASTISPPAWPMAPLPLLAASVPATRPLPRLNAPLLVAVRLPVFSVPSVKAPLSRIDTPLPVRLTAPPN